MKILHLTLKKKWFDMIASGEKKEEYREVKQYWVSRLVDEIRFEDNGDRFGSFYHKKSAGWCTMEAALHYDYVCLRNGYAKNAPTITLKCLDIFIGTSIGKWSDDWQSAVFVIKLGEIIKQPT